MPDRLFYPLAALAAVLLIAFAAVYPQGIGARSPKPFGHPVAPLPVAKTAKGATPDAKKIPLRGPF